MLYLTLGYNQLYSIPDFTGLASLTTLDLGYNQNMRSVNTTALSPLTGLKTIVLAFIMPNSISQFPTLPGLKGLYLMGNKLDHIQPDMSQACHTLTHLFINNNRMTQLPNCTGIHRTITFLSINSNYVYYFPKLASYTNLRELRLKNNFITVIPQEAYNFMKTGSLQLDGNPITCAQDSCWLKSISQRVTLTCQDGTPWSSVASEVVCEGMCSEVISALGKLSLSLSWWMWIRHGLLITQIMNIFILTC